MATSPKKTYPPRSSHLSSSSLTPSNSCQLSSSSSPLHSLSSQMPCSNPFVFRCSLRCPSIFSLFSLLTVFCPFLVEREISLVHAHIHVAPEHFDSYNPSSLRQVTFCGWVRHQKRLFSSSSSSSKGVLSSYCGDTLLKTATVRLLDSVCSFTSGRKRLEENGEEEEEDYFAYLRRAKRIALSSSSPSWRGRGEGRGDLSTKTKKNRFTSIEGHHDWNSYYSFRHSLHDGNSRDSAEELLLSPHSHLYDTIGESLPSSLPRRLSKADEGNSHRKEKKEYEEDTSSSSPSSQRALKEALAALHAALEGDEHLSSSSPADSSTVSSSPFSSPHSGSHSSPSKKDRKEKKKERYTHSSSTSSQATQSSSRGWSFRSFLSAFISSVSLTIATEFGDRTFFIAALLSLKYRKILVFVATCSSLFLMTAFSTLVGHLFHYVAAYLPLCIDRDLPIDAWLSTVMLFLFAFIHLRSYELPHHGGQEKEEEKEKEGDRRGGGEEEKKKRQQKEEEEKKIGASMKEEGEKEEEEDERREKGRERGEKRATKTKMGEKMRGENAGMRKKDVKKKRSTSSSFLLSESETEIEEFLSDTEEIRRKKSQVSLREERRKEEKKRSDTCRSSMPTSCPYFHSSPSSFSPQDVIEREFRENSSPFSDTTSNDSMEGENSRNLPLLLSSSPPPHSPSTFSSFLSPPLFDLSDRALPVLAGLKASPSFTPYDLQGRGTVSSFTESHPSSSSSSSTACIDNYSRRISRSTSRSSFRCSSVMGDKGMEASAGGGGGGNENFEEAQEEMERIQYTRLGLHPTSVKILWEVFLAISAAEIGDKSMVATLTLSTSQDALGVFLGGCVGHAGVTLLAVVAGLLFQGRFDENKMNLACAILFFIFGLGTLYEALAR